MSTRSVALRWWRSLLDTQRPVRPRRPASLLASGRGREGHSLGQRFVASFTGTPLAPAAALPPPTPARTAGGESAASGRSPARSWPVAAGPLWFPLPRLPTAGGLAASGSDRVVLESRSPDGKARYMLRTDGAVPPAYRLELVVRETTARLLVSEIRYTGADARERLLLVPLVQGRLGPAASLVRLPAFTAASSEQWTALAPEPVTAGSAWDAETVADSVRAALNRATREAWAQVGELIGPDLRTVIDRGLA